MQLALRSGSADAGFMADPASVTRTNKILIGAVAALSASVIAVSPAAQTSASMVVHEAQLAQQRAVQLVAEVTDSPLAVYGDLVNDTVYNVTTLLKQYAAAPFPILGAIAQNQLGYLKRIFDFSVVSDAFQTWWNDGSRESAPGKELLASVQSALASGNLATAYQNFNSLALFGIQNTVLPWLNNWLFSSTTTMGVPQQIAQNLSNALGAFFSTGTLVYGAFQSLYAPVSGAAFQLSRDLSAIGSTLAKGNLVGAVTALVNTPASVLNALLNGFSYDASTNPWAGLLSPKDPACTGRCSSGGPISQFLITIAQKVAAAIKNVSTTTTTTAAVAAASTGASSLVADTLGTSATSYTLSLDSATKSPATSAKGETALTGTAAAKPGDTTASTGTTKAEDTTSAAGAAEDATGTTATKASGTTAASNDTKADDTKAATGTTKSEDSTTSASSATKTDAGSTTKGSASDDSAKSGSASDDSAKGGSAKHNSAKGGSAKHNPAKSGSAKHAGKHAGKHKSGSN